MHHRVVAALVVELVQEGSHRVQARPLLVVAPDRHPRGVVGVRRGEHGLLGGGVVLPPVQRLQIHGRQLPAPHRIDLPDREPGALLALCHRDPELREVDAGLDQHPLELGGLLHERRVVLGAAEAHDPLHARAVVPGAIEQDHLSRRREVLDVALEVPLPLLGGGGLVERHHARRAGIQVLGEALDRAALARRVAALEEEDVPDAVILAPVLQLQQLDLEAVLLLLVLLATHELVVGVVLTPRLDRAAARIDELGIRAMAFGDGVALEDEFVDELAQVLALRRRILEDLVQFERLHALLLRTSRCRQPSVGPRP